MALRVAITGALGNLGSKVARHLEKQAGTEVVLLDRRAEPGVHLADFADATAGWDRHLAGADAVVHFAADPSTRATWASAHRNNVIATQNLLEACERHQVPRFILATTNQVMGGYRHRPDLLTTDIQPAPLNPYAWSKWFCEEVCRQYCARSGLSVVAFRIGYIRPGDNLAEDAIGIGTWGQEMWLSNRDMLSAMDLAIKAPADLGFALVNLTSNNEGMRWDLEATRKAIGYVPQDGIARLNRSAEILAAEEAARATRSAPGTWLDENAVAIPG